MTKNSPYLASKAALKAMRQANEKLSMLDIPFDGACQAEVDSIKHDLQALLDRMAKAHQSLVG